MISALVAMEDFQEILSSISSLSSSSSLPNTDPLSIDGETWLMAEQRTEEILCIIQPTIVSEKARKEVIDYIRRLIQGHYVTEVFPFGSVPLKTYLPDGDIDLTAISHQNVEEDLARGVCSILEDEERNSEFQVKDVQYIRAQVKIVKCTVNSIAVDISFNQLGGLCTMCFLEQVDQLLGKDHLFKRSIILIKAWCYYESRILGAYHGLISTYALETLVMYIINLYHSSLHGPLEVLYKFLDYYSTFDWDSYCVSVNGPVSVYTLPKIVEITPEDDGNGLLLSKEFLRNCRDTFSAPIRAHETRTREFPVKYLNILDPLKDNNNLGHSVSKGNSHRIRCALSYGAQKLGEILTLTGQSMGEKLEDFFTTILNRNGRGLRPDIQVPVPAFGTGRSQISELSGDYDCYYGVLRCGQQYHDCNLSGPVQPGPPSSPQIWNKSAWEALAQSGLRNWNLFCRRGTDLFVPRLPLCRHIVSRPSASTFRMEDTRKSRGTGTYIPNMTRHSYRDMHTRVRRKYSESNIRDLLSLHKNDQTEVPSQTDKGRNGCCLDLSLEEFPLLTGIRNLSLSERHQCGVLVEKAEDYSPSFWGIQFGTYGSPPSPLGLPLRVASKEADSLVSTWDSLRVCPTLLIQRRQQSWESDNEMDLVHPYQLEDDKDFPALSLSVHFGAKSR